MKFKLSPPPAILFALLVLLAFSCSKENDKLPENEVVHEEQVDLQQLAFVPVGDFERMRALPENDFSLPDVEINRIAEVLVNRIGTSQEDFNLAIEELFKMNNSDFGKCFNLYFSLKFEYSKKINNLNDAEIEDYLFLQELLTSVIKTNTNTKMSSFIRLPTEEAKVFLDTEYNVFLEEKRAYANKCYFDTSCGSEGMNHFGINHTDSVTPYFALFDYCAQNFIIGGIVSTGNPIIGTLGLCDVILEYEIPAISNPDPILSWGTEDLFTGFYIDQNYPVNSQGIGGLSGFYIPGESVAKLTIGASVNLHLSGSYLRQHVQLFIN